MRGHRMLCVLLLTSLPLLGQTGKPSAAKTKIEAFEGKTGTVVVTGFTSIGIVRGELGGQATVEAVEINEASSGLKVFGVRIDVEKGDNLETQNISFLDADEIESLIKGIDYIAKLDASATQMKTFQADYRSKGDLEVSTFSSSNGKIGTAITSGEIGPARIFLSHDGLMQFRGLIFQAKAAIEAARGTP